MEIKIIQGRAVVDIQPLKAKFTDEDNAIYLAVVSQSDDLSGSCVLSWSLLNENSNPMASENILLQGDDYKNWNGDNTFPFTFVASSLKLTLL